MQIKIFKALTDQTGHQVVLNTIPKRIVSLVPSQTELLFDLGLEENIVGITKFCIHPKEKCTLKTKIGGTKNFNIEKIKSLKPDLIIANKEENYKEGIEELRNYFPVYTSDVYNLSSALKMILEIADLTNKEKEGKSLTVKIKKAFNKLNKKKERKLSAAYLIWNDPKMVAGNHNFIDAMLQMSGFKNIFSTKSERYPIIYTEDLVAKKPNIVMLSSEPYPFKEKHKTELKNILKNSTIEIVDGEMFSWYGSRLLKTPDYLVSLRNKINNIVVF
jgi:ABC-type Fe3+-hydroxamate transport system substrate-binding protein